MRKGFSKPLLLPQLSVVTFWRDCIQCIRIFFSAIFFILLVLHSDRCTGYWNCPNLVAVNRLTICSCIHPLAFEERLMPLQITVQQNEVIKSQFCSVFVTKQLSAAPRKWGAVVCSTDLGRWMSRRCGRSHLGKITPSSSFLLLSTLSTMLYFMESSSDVLAVLAVSPPTPLCLPLSSLQRRCEKQKEACALCKGCLAETK